MNDVTYIIHKVNLLHTNFVLLASIVQSLHLVYFIQCHHFTTLVFGMFTWQISFQLNVPCLIPSSHTHVPFTQDLKATRSFPFHLGLPSPNYLEQYLPAVLGEGENRRQYAKFIEKCVRNQTQWDENGVHNSCGDHHIPDYDS